MSLTEKERAEFEAEFERYFDDEGMRKMPRHKDTAEHFYELGLAKLRPDASGLVEAVQNFISATQERSKIVGHNKMFAPDEYVAMIAKLNDYERAKEAE